MHVHAYTDVHSALKGAEFEADDRFRLASSGAVVKGKNKTIAGKKLETGPSNTRQ